MHPLIGKQLDKYRIDSLLGEGGMGAVFRGWDTSLSRPVAIKVMHPQFASQPAFRERFQQEARAPAGLSHPSIVHIYEFGSGHDLLYIVMEFVPGSTLTGHIRRAGGQGRVIDLREALLVVAQTADALAYAHRHGVIHRDIKPDNIMLRKLEAPDREGDPPLRAVVTDFGLAKLLEGGVETQTGTFLGTLPYMSPEQCFGRPIDGRSDLYSLGVVLYRLTTGQLPLDIRSPTDAILKHERESPQPPRRIRPGLPGDVERIILKALAKRPEDRYQDARDFFLDLRRAADALTDDVLTEYASTEEVHSFITSPDPEGPAPQPPAELFDAIPPAPSGPAGYQLHIMVPDRTIRSVVVEKNSLVIGRDETCEVTIDDPLISRQHARIDFSGGKVTVTDLKSTNGTFLEEAGLLPGVREPWDPARLLRVGGTWLRLEEVGAKESVPGTLLPHEPATRMRETEPQSRSMSGWISLFLPQTSFTCEPRTGQVIPVQVLNQGTIVDHFTVTLEGMPAGWSPPVPVELHLMPDVRGETTLHLPPPPLDLTAGRYPVHVRAASRSSPEEFAQAELTLIVLPRYDFDVTLSPAKVMGYQEGRFRLEVQNRGNMEARLQFEAQDAGSACQFEFSPNPLTIGPRSSGSTSLVVKTEAGLRARDGVAHAITVKAKGEGFEFEEVVRGEWVQKPPDIALSVMPARQSQARQASFHVEIRNLSPVDLRLECAAWDTAGEVACEVLPDRLDLPGGTLRNAELRVHRQGVHKEKNPRLHSLLIAVRRKGEEEILEQARVEWEELPSPAPMNLPEPVTVAKGVDLPEPVRSKPSLGNSLAGCLTLVVGLVVTAYFGFMAGEIVDDITNNDALAAWIAALSIWGIGLWITIRLYKGMRKE